jgi:hypothetical protein
VGGGESITGQYGANKTDWDRKLHSAFRAYQTSYKISILSTSFWMAFGLEAVMPSEFIVPSLRIQSEYRLNESASEQARVEQLLRLEEDRIWSMEAMEQEQRLRKAFIDHHRKRNEEWFGIEKVVLLYQSRSGLMPGKLWLRWTRPYWIVKSDNGTYQLGILSREVLPQWANGFHLKPYYGKMPPNPFMSTTGSGVTSGDVPTNTKT